MKKNAFKMLVFTGEDVKIDELSKSPCAPEDIIAALRFLTPESMLQVSVASFEVKEDGSFVEI